MRELKFIKQYEGIDFYCFSPSFFHSYYNCYNKKNRPEYIYRLTHIIRMRIQLIFGGYKVYYMYNGDNIIGHLVVSRGGTRVSTSSKKDIIIGPIWVCPDERGKGYGTKGIAAILNQMHIHYDYAYEFIAPTNVASIRSVEKNDFEFIGKAIETGILRKIHLAEEGNWLLFRKSCKEK